MYQLARSDGHVLDATPRQRDAVEGAARLPAVDAQAVLRRAEQALALRMEVNGPAQASTRPR